MKISFRQRAAEPPPGYVTHRFAVQDMHCGNCAMSVDWAVEALDGVAESTTSYANATTTVLYDPTRLTLDAIAAAIAGAGYRADPMPTANTSPIQATRAPHRSEVQMETVTFEVPAISCDHCVATIKRVVIADVPGVTDVAGDPAAKRVTIAFDPPATVEQIVAAMIEWDYPPNQQ